MASVHHVSTSLPDPHQWTVNSVANANLTLFKHRLHNYREFGTPGNVKGLGGKIVSAQGIGSVTLTGSNEMKYTVKDVLYVPQSTYNIISMMKLKCCGLNFHFLDDHNDGDFLFSAQRRNFEILGHAIDNIFCFTEGSPSSQGLVATQANENSMMQWRIQTQWKPPRSLPRLRHALLTTSGTSVLAMHPHLDSPNYRSSSLSSIHWIVSPVYVPNNTKTRSLHPLQKLRKREKGFTQTCLDHPQPRRAGQSMLSPSSMTTPISVGSNWSQTRTHSPFEMYSPLGLKSLRIRETRYNTYAQMAVESTKGSWHPSCNQLALLTSKQHPIRLNRMEK